METEILELLKLQERDIWEFYVPERHMDECDMESIFIALIKVIKKLARDLKYEEVLREVEKINTIETVASDTGLKLTDECKDEMFDNLWSD